MNLFREIAFTSFIYGFLGKYNFTKTLTIFEL
ncbi:hypothetical protein M2480_002297 [Parabacteroides sp. PFB2-12]|nr:hypothetical protein [Parabacteroides sp. PM6-13]MDH6391302.1 hypothetical protein [Parabacteroides sp. PFB2-12]